MSMSDLAAAVSRDIDTAREELIDLCGRLVAATSVNPLTAERDINIPGLIARTYRHPDCGVYAEVVSDGRIAIGDRVRAA